MASAGSLKFGFQIQQFADNLSALREFVDLIAPLLDQRSTEELSKNAQEFIPLVVALSRLQQRDDLTLTPERENELRQQYGAAFEIVTVSEKDGEPSSVKINFSKPGSDVAFKILKRQTDRQRLLYGNALIALVSAAEWFLAQVLHFHFRRQPGSLGLRDKVFSYEDLEHFGSVDDAKIYLIDSKVEDVLRGSLDDWISLGLD